MFALICIYFLKHFQTDFQFGAFSQLFGFELLFSALRGAIVVGVGERSRWLRELVGSLRIGLGGVGLK